MSDRFDIRASSARVSEWRQQERRGQKARPKHRRRSGESVYGSWLLILISGNVYHSKRADGNVIKGGILTESLPLSRCHRLALSVIHYRRSRLIAMNRRQILQTGAGALAGPFVPAAPAAATPKRALMKLGCQSGPTSEQRLQFFKRHSVNNINGYA